ncbi:MAG: hypothetical protein HOP02_12155 [Methylococcaceae bacterium]|nr:hypothetical protein [Methylococcaceae bacterium]
MGENQKLMAVVVGMFAIAFIMVAVGKQDESPEIVAERTRLLTFSSMQGMAGQKCPVAIRNETGTEVYFPTGNESDKETYVTLNYKGTEKGDKFKTASCTLSLELGGISKLIIDDKVVIDKKKMTTTNN